MVRIVVPALEQEVAHLESAIQAYKSGDTAPVQRFVTEEYVDLKDNFSHHRYMYTGPNLIALLEQAGFANCQLCQSGEGNFPDINLLENRPGVIVEAIKP